MLISDGVTIKFYCSKIKDGSVFILDNINVTSTKGNLKKEILESIAEKGRDFFEKLVTEGVLEKVEFCNDSLELQVSCNFLKILGRVKCLTNSNIPLEGLDVLSQEIYQLISNGNDSSFKCPCPVCSGENLNAIELYGWITKKLVKFVSHSSIEEGKLLYIRKQYDCVYSDSMALRRTIRMVGSGNEELRHKMLQRYAGATVDALSREKMFNSFAVMNSAYLMEKVASGDSNKLKSENIKLVLHLTIHLFYIFDELGCVEFRAFFNSLKEEQKHSKEALLAITEIEALMEDVFVLLDLDCPLVPNQNDLELYNHMFPNIMFRKELVNFRM